MTVLEVTLDKKRDAEFTRSDWGINLTYTVKTDDPNDHFLTVASAVPFNLGDIYELGNEINENIRCSRIYPKAENDTFWKVAVEFASREKVNNPLNDPPTIELVFAQSEKLLERDINGKALRNSVGDRFDDVITREDSQPILRITRNEPVSQALFGVDFRDTINRTTWMGAPRRTVKFQPPTLRSQYDANIGVYFEKSYEFKFSDETWRFILLNQGYYEKNGTDRVRILDKNGDPMQTPLALSQAGEVLEEGESPVFLEFDGYREITFPDFGVSF